MKEKIILAVTSSCCVISNLLMHTCKCIQLSWKLVYDSFES
jgi:hypothetical protein